VPSTKHRTSSKSGASQKSTRKPATSPKAGNTSATAPASFEQVFGKPKPPDEQKRLSQALTLLDNSNFRLKELEGLEIPKLAFPRQRHQQRLSRERKHNQRIREFVESLAPGATTGVIDHF